MRNPKATLINLKRGKGLFHPMSELTGDIRLFIETQIDILFKDPNSLTNTNRALTTMGIQPNLETTLSLITGIMLGSALGMWLVKRSKEGKSAKPSEQELKTFTNEVGELLARRAMELRLHFSKSKYL